MLSIGRYELFKEIASGGMATVFLGRITSVGGFTRVVAIKRLHPHCAKEPELRATLIDEARLTSRIRHPNVVPVLDIVEVDGNGGNGEEVREDEADRVGTSREICLVSEYVHGESLDGLMRSARSQGKTIPPPVACAIVVAMLRGLHAAHEAKDEQGRLLDLVHRDVSPQNVLADVEGLTRVVDFGIAKAFGRLQGNTRDGAIKGKLAYLAPEQLRRRPVTRRTDIYAAGVVLWELLTGRKLFDAENEAEAVASVLRGAISPPSSIGGSDDDSGEEKTKRQNGVLTSLDAITLRATARNPAQRFSTALEMAEAIEEEMKKSDSGGVASPAEVADCVRALAQATISERTALLEALERIPPPAPPVVVVVASSPPPMASSREREKDDDEQETVGPPREESSITITSTTSTRHETQLHSVVGNADSGHQSKAFWAGALIVGCLTLIIAIFFGLGGRVSLRPPATAVGGIASQREGPSSPPSSSRFEASSSPSPSPSPSPPSLSSSEAIAPSAVSSASKAAHGPPKSSPAKRSTITTGVAGSAATPKKDCDPYVDERGIVHYKEGCLN